MKTLKLLTIVLATQYMTSCTSMVTSKDEERPFARAVVASYISMDTNELNEDIAKQEGINVIPLEIVIDILNINSEQKDLAIYQSFSSMEDKERVTVTVIRDGYLDDSLRGEWNEFEMKRNSGQPWRIINARKAYSCWRLESNTYQNELCP